VCSSCQGDKLQKPKVFIEQDKMEQILMEIHISDAIAAEKANGNAALEKNIADLGQQQILVNYKIKKQDFDSVYAYYVRQPDVLNEMYTNIITELSKKQAQLAR
jgi:hypothetical protein